ncbi:MAG: class I SAM-dependent methyltransferase [Candidatus Levybacteria bacterium]|nr:class I SAM-dependent methyltransferase [Candidatus Levybacteria bacterium]
MNSDNHWNTLSTLFDTTSDESNISSLVADNIFIAWPEMLQFINAYGPLEKNVRLLEFGCGSGSFAYKLSKLGYTVTGVDYAEEMIKIAKTAYDTHIDFLSGDSSILSRLSPFSIVTSVMTFQFIENIDSCFNDIANVLEKDGIFVFAVHNPAMVQTYLKARILFEDFDSIEKPSKGILNLRGNRIPIFIRTAEEYNQLLQAKGFEPLLEVYPPFTEEFLTKYPMDAPTHQPEFLILGYKKTQ